jgi:hypothetical protein
MRLWRPRWSVRWLMLAVALVASALGGERWHRRAMARRDEYRIRAIVFTALEEIDKGEFEGCVRGGRIPEPDLRKAEYHAAMRRKYEEAAAFPWFPVPPDPPEPR